MERIFFVGNHFGQRIHQEKYMFFVQEQERILQRIGDGGPDFEEIRWILSSSSGQFTRKIKNLFIQKMQDDQEEEDGLLNNFDVQN